MSALFQTYKTGSKIKKKVGEKVVNKSFIIFKIK